METRDHFVAGMGLDEIYVAPAVTPMESSWPSGVRYTRRNTPDGQRAINNRKRKNRKHDRIARASRKINRK